MSANVESMFFVGRETPWHGLGTSVETAPDSKTAIKLAGLDWNVVQEDVYTKSGILIPGYKANKRETDDQFLGMVTDRYKICQNTDAFDFTDSLLGEGVTYETAGSLAKGKRIWLLARMERRIMTDEEIDPYLVFTTSHDGKGAIMVASTPVRVVCQNTLNFALSTAKRQWSTCHKGDLNAKLEEARHTLMNANAYYEALEEEFGELKLQKLTDDKVHEFIETLLPINEFETARKKRNLELAREEMWIRYNAPDLEAIERSAYRFLMAVSDYVDHSEPARRTSTWKENRFMSIVDGNPLMDKAKLLCAAAA